MMVLRLILLAVIVAVTGWCPGCALEIGNNDSRDSGLPDGEVGSDAETDLDGSEGDELVCPACAVNEVCQDGLCVVVCEDECIAGHRRCAVGGYETCGDYDDDPCTEWSDPVACAAGTNCDEGECVVDCHDACVAGNHRCMGAGYEICDNYDEDLCLEWGGRVDCPDDLICAGGECVCADECAQGLTRCADGGFETCGEYDDDTCLEWGGLTACDAGQICELGECVVDCGQQCPGGTQRCATGGIEGIESCGDYAGDSCLEWGGLHLCDAGLVCDPAALQCLRPYPPGPYGTGVGAVLANLCLEECKCDGSVAKGVPFCMRDLLDSKATLISVHSGWCTACRNQTTQAEQLYQAYQAQGLGMVFVFYEDDLENDSRQAVLDYACWEKGWYGLTFMMAIDPGLQVMLPYFYEGSIPLNIIVDDEMVIRYVLEGYDPVSMEATIQLLLAE